MKEIWKDIDGFAGKYQVSNRGRFKIFNYMNTGKTEVTTGFIDSCGYKSVCLSNNGENQQVKLHRLVAKYFIPNPGNLPEVNHKDEDKTNNCIENLEWCTSKYNCNYGTRNIRMGAKHGKPLIGISKFSGLVVEFDSTREAHRVTGINQGSISACCRGKLNSSGGFIWMYKEVE